MIKNRKQIASILIGLLLVSVSFAWMKHSTTNMNPIPAFVFAAGLISVLGTVKRILLDIARKCGPSRGTEDRQE